jgi:hypothetical protein
MKTKQQLTSELSEHMRKGGGTYREWYVGISSDARARLFNGHGVAEKGDWWIYTEADTNQDARDVEQYFLKLGCDGGPGGGDYTSKMIYAYKKNSHTRP